jgi:abhydrolase domain-containing protein 13
MISLDEWIEIGGIPRHTRHNPRRYRSPQEHGLPFENHKIRCSDGVSIHAWLILQPQPMNAPTLIFFHGNAGNIGLRLPNAVQMYHNLQCNILMVEYRGYGDSDTVTPNETGLKLDAEAALRFAQSHDQLDSNRLFLFGRSLGGAVAFHLAHYAEQQQQSSSTPLAGIIVENTFLSIRHMVDHLMPLVAPLKDLILRIGWNSNRLAPILTTPILYLAGAKDQLVPHSHMLELYQQSLTSSRFARIHVIESGTHNETWMQGGKAYWDSIQRFLAQVRDLPQLSKSSSHNRSTMSDSSLYHAHHPSQDVPPASGGSNLISAVQMGDTSSIATAPASSSIPIMPNGLMNIAMEAAASIATANSKKKDQKKE